MPPELGPWESVEVRTALAWGALIWLGWEWVVTFPSEYKYILKGEHSPAKLLYLSTRYIGLSAQILNQVLIAMFLRKAILGPGLCRAWFVFQSMIVQILYSSVQAVLMYRVYALYGRTLRMKAFMILVFITESVSMLSLGAHVTMSINFSPVCLVHNTPLLVLPMSGIVVATQCLVWCMTLRKRTAFEYRNHPLMKTLTRDGGIVWAVLSLFFTVAAPYAYYVRAPTHSTFTFLITLLSIIGCRLILSTHHTPMQGKGETSDVELSTQFTTSIDTDISDVISELGAPQ
ncbi:hypothetical protein BDZ94DRAFT_1261148 [Collybia nuda]|uniref:DUF6533 domain-containing protein n=1 Tax=Collybia nuda TaxID=64659 RepID=A0A9P5Y320_9AGAR|nr:hypothetical protein BDZ94DRAFT_1261148 [Collybia nuda]